MHEHLRLRTRAALGNALVLPAAVLAFAALAAACGSSAPVTYSAPVGISLDVRSADVVSGQISVDKSISTETGNPYGAFVNAAEKALGHAPSRIVVTSATLVMDPASSTQVTALEQVFGGAVQVSFVPNGSRVSLPAATAPQVSGIGPVAMVDLFDSAQVPSTDYPDIVGGSFKVLLTGAAVADFATRSATADLTATFTFEAFP